MKVACETTVLFEYLLEYIVKRAALEEWVQTYRHTPASGDQFSFGTDRNIW